jgi:hypothetical protein
MVGDIDGGAGGLVALGGAAEALVSMVMSVHLPSEQHGIVDSQPAPDRRADPWP